MKVPFLPCLWAAAFCLLSGCRENGPDLLSPWLSEEQAHASPLLGAYLNPDRPKNQIWVYSQGVYPSREQPQSHSVKAKIEGPDGKPVYAGELEVGSLQTRADSATRFFYYPRMEGLSTREQQAHVAQPLFGQTVPVRMSNPSGALELDDSWYVPQDFSGLSLSPLQFSANDNLTISPGSRLSWTPDPQNAELLLIASFSPDALGNEALPRSYEEVDLYKVIPDNGSYTVSSADLAELPNGAVVDFEIRRMSSREVQGRASGQRYLLHGFSVCVASLEISR
jgi:hypothetical protein